MTYRCQRHSIDASILQSLPYVWLKRVVPWDYSASEGYYDGIEFESDVNLYILLGTHAKSLVEWGWGNKSAIESFVELVKDKECAETIVGLILASGML